MLPISEIDRSFLGAIAVCTELNTPAGPIDNFLVTPDGMPVLVECKLWRNPQARREVVGQALDYAKELAQWTSADIDREVRRRGVPSIFSVVETSASETQEADFHDALTRNLANGRCLLLIVGDGIREGVESIFEHLRAQAILHFSFVLIELPVFSLPSGERIALPRIIAKTSVEVRRVIELPSGLQMSEPEGSDTSTDLDPEASAMGDDRQQFWQEFLSVLSLDDPEQPIPRPTRQGFIAFSLPAPQTSSWITVFRDINAGEVGLFLSSTRDTEGHRAADRVIDDWDKIAGAIGGSSTIIERNGKRALAEKQHFGNLSDPSVRRTAFIWLAERVNTYINVLRPAIRSALLKISEE